MNKLTQIWIYEESKQKLDKDFTILYLKSHPEMIGIQLSYANKIKKILDYYLED